MSRARPILLLITACSPEIQKVRHSRVLNFQQITMPYLAAFVPSHWKVLHVDEAADAVDFELPVDLVAITFHTPSASHAYALAARFRQRGATVVLGGPHVSLLPDEAQAHADVIFIGEAEAHWRQFLAEFEAGQHQRRYCCIRPPSLDEVPSARHDLFHRRDPAAGVMFATRGCPHRCDFCTVAVMYQRCLRKRPVEEVAREYASFRGKVIILWDDNIAGDIPYAKALFRALTPHRKWWSSQASIHAAQDNEFLESADLSARSLTGLGTAR
jgi:radical SAM superfamily enzyme YgiQ (UPF0313 family)